MIPRFSIIIPFKNNVDQLTRLLISLRKFLKESDLEEIIIVNNNSNTISSQIAQDIVEDYSNKTKIYNFVKSNSSYASRNYGFKKISKNSNIVIFLDSDTIVDSKWFFKVRKKVRKLYQEKIGRFILTGIAKKYGKKDLNNWNIYEFVDNFLFLNQQNYVENGYCATFCCIVPCKYFIELEMFPELISSGDKQFGLKSFSKIKQKPILQKDIIVFHPLRSNRNEFLKKIKRIGIGKSQVNKSLNYYIYHGILSPYPKFFIAFSAAIIYKIRNNKNLFFILYVIICSFYLYIMSVFSYKIGFLRNKK